ncbi:chaperone NapD [Flammeovirga kamogawensis]|uniref:Chaperone NapD n=1 Tax=Flammeovirga kamogawensis TaxID=373891 RepID=A0ABX8H433_9BACT|nr:chaperone NapD [Flammeovirga kamogawensis]MBB6461935.1 nitrate reductase NapAB chaperone NapD [Flammeovirga kamogawensis]QWG10458.1 chaperone NapD [Flammeovirga kamogawensis]
MKSDMIKALNGFKNCEVIPSENKDIVVVLLESDSKEIEKEQIQNIQNLPSVNQLSMVSGYQG